MHKFLFAVLITFLAVAADASCLKCDQSTGWWCFMSTFGTKAHCDSPSSAGCITWGSCTVSECDDSCIQNIAVLRFTERMQIASVTVVVPLRRS